MWTEYVTDTKLFFNLLPCLDVLAVFATQSKKDKCAEIKSDTKIVCKTKFAFVIEIYFTVLQAKFVDSIVLLRYNPQKAFAFGEKVPRSGG